MWLGIAISVGLFTWAILGMAALGTLPKDIAKHFDDPVERVAWFVRGLAVLLTIVGIVSYFSTENFLHDFSAEMVGIGLGVWGIDELNRWRSGQEYKRGIIRQMASFSNDFALEAARIAKNKGWLEDGSLAGADLRRANLARADLWNVNLAGANLGHANFAGAELWEANLAGADLSGANLAQAKLSYANLEGAKLFGAAILTDAVLEEANLIGVDLEFANLARAILPGAKLARAILSGANLTGADLSGANLAGADLEFANLAGAKLEEANLTGARYNTKTPIYASRVTGWPDGLDPKMVTRWPEDFDPKQAGAINGDELSKQEREEWLKKYRPKQQ